MNRVIVAAAAALLLTGCGGGDQSEPTNTPPPPDPIDTSVTVKYRIQGTTPTADVTLATPSGTTQRTDIQVGAATLGWWDEDYQMEPGDFAYVSAQVSSAGGEATCIILLHGKELARNTATGAHSITTCQATIP